MAMMKAVQFQPGGPENLFVASVQQPVPKDQEVLIKVVTTAINRADTLQVRTRVWNKFQPNLWSSVFVYGLNSVVP